MLSTSRWLPQLGVLLLSCALAACSTSTATSSDQRASAPSAGTQQETGANTSATTLHVVAAEFTFALDAAPTRAGPTTVSIKNDGAAPHDFAIEGNGIEQKTAMLDPGQTASLTVDLQPGTYTYVCTMPGHARLGMQGTLIVQ